MVKIFIANRGEIACRIAATAHRMGIATCGVSTPQDARTKHVRILQQTRMLPRGDLSMNYLNQELLIEFAQEFGADAVHPGYGFLSENADFAQRVSDAGLIWIGPPPEAMRALGDKVQAKKVASRVGVPVAPWMAIDQEVIVKEVVEQIGFPALIKAAHGGGGRGQRVVRQASEMEEALRAARSEALRSFGSSDVFVEKFLEMPKHIEVQIIADRKGNVFAVGERDCSLQRRNQKLIEETPATVLDAATREQIHKAAFLLAAEVGYTNAGTVEFLAQKGAGGTWEFYFMELNARLQVEHPVTEMVTGLDLVELQIRAARGEDLTPFMKDLKVTGHAMELRLCAEDPANQFLPTPGPIAVMHFPAAEDLRIDSGFETGDVIPQEYDSLFAKMIVHAPTREAVIARFEEILRETLIAGTITNKFYLQDVLKHDDFVQNELHTRWIETHPELTPVDSSILDPELKFWGKKFSSDLLVQRSSPQRGQNKTGKMLFSFQPDASHGAPSPQGVCIAGWFESADQENIYSAGWVNRFEICITFQNKVQGVGQRRLTFAGQYESEDLRTHHGPLTAQVPGVVLEVRAAANQIVEAFQPILIVEAMKIEMPFSLPIAVKIKDVHVKSGDRILPGQTLVTWEPHE